MPELGKIGLDTAVQGVPVKKKQSVPGLIDMSCIIQCGQDLNQVHHVK